jgi:hypothetical protein
VSFDSKLIAVERDFKVFPPVKTDGARQMFKNPLTLDSVWTSHRTMLPSPLNPTSHSDISYIILVFGGQPDRQDRPGGRGQVSLHVLEGLLALDADFIDQLGVDYDSLL